MPTGVGQLRFAESTPASDVAAGKVSICVDTSDEKVKVVHNSDVVDTLTPDGWRDQNILANGDFAFAQRQAPATLTSQAATADRHFNGAAVLVGADRWGMTVQISSLQYQRVDNRIAPEDNIEAGFYGKYKQITAAGKFMITQVVEGNESACMRGTVVRLQMKMRWSIAPGGMKIRIGLISNTGTVNAPTNPFTTSWGTTPFNGQDPVLGANLTYLAPIQTLNAFEVDQAGMTCALTEQWTSYAATFLIPATCKNVIAAIWSDGQLAINDECNISEVALHHGPEARMWINMPYQVERRRCQRFYAKTFLTDTLPAASLAATTGGYRTILSKSGSATANCAWAQWRFPVPMVKAPAVTLFTVVGAGATMYRITGATPVVQGTGATSNITEQGVDITCTAEATVNGAVGDQMGGHAVANAEI